MGRLKKQTSSLPSRRRITLYAFHLPRQGGAANVMRRFSPGRPVPPAPAAKKGGRERLGPRTRLPPPRPDRPHARELPREPGRFGFRQGGRGPGQARRLSPQRKDGREGRARSGPGRFWRGRSCSAAPGPPTPSARRAANFPSAPKRPSSTEGDCRGRAWAGATGSGRGRIGLGPGG